MSANELQSRTLNATAGVQITNVAAAFLSATAPEQVYVKAILLENTTAANVACTCQITDGNPGGTYNLLIPAKVGIVPWVGGTAAPQQSLWISFQIPYRLKHGALWGLTSVADGVKAVVYTIQ